MAKNFKIPEFEYSGIKKITIPKVDSDFRAENGYGWEVIKKYLPKVLPIHEKNANKIEYLYNYFLGQQDILLKKRLHKVDEDNNNIVIENHAKRQVEFKVGFIDGEQRDYTHKIKTNSDDLTYLNRYFSDCGFFSKDAELKEWCYATGIGVTCTKPRTDIILDDGIDEMTKNRKVRYATIDDGFNIEYEAPFEFDCVDPKENFVVYSSSSNKQPLFCVSFVEVELEQPIVQTPTIGKELLVETRYATFRFKANSTFSSFYWENDQYVERIVKNLHYLPLIEFSRNKDRIGIVETNRHLFNSINLILSSVSDMTVDNGNAILVFKNVDITAKEVTDMKEAGAIIISDNVSGGGGNAELKTITIEIPYDKLTIYLDQIRQQAYDIEGVPLASGQVTSGGDTGQARLLGGGWNNAYTIAHKEIQSFKQQDYEQLKLILLLCKTVPNCPLDELYASQVDINYRINKSDNLQVKAQSMKYFDEMGIPEELNLQWTGLSNDVKTDAENWRKRKLEIAKMQVAEQQAESTTTEVIETDTN